MIHVNENDQTEVGKFCKMINNSNTNKLSSYVMAEMVRIITLTKNPALAMFVWGAAHNNNATLVAIHPFVKERIVAVALNKPEPQSIFDCFKNNSANVNNKNNVTPEHNVNNTSVKIGSMCEKCHTEVKERQLFNSLYIGCNC